VRKVSHRPYTTGFYLASRGDNPQSAEAQVYSGSYSRGYDFIAVVMDYDPDTGIAIIEQRNKFVIGDEIEIVRASGANFRQIVEMLTDIEDNAVQEAPHPQQNLKLKLARPVRALDMIRRKRDGI